MESGMNPDKTGAALVGLSNVHKIGTVLVGKGLLETMDAVSTN